MSNRPVLYPSADHPISVSKHSGRVTVSYEGRTVADTENALTLREASYPPVHYIPLSDVDATVLERTDHSTYCPFKGDASYYSLKGASGETAENAVWTYESPRDAVAEIAGHVAFYPNVVDTTEESA
jgi:uncharacterized protein (DUF427 family)